jgi:hypothetical protein
MFKAAQKAALIFLQASLCLYESPYVTLKLSPIHNSHRETQ